MKLSIEEKIERETWEVLKQLKRDFFLTPKDRYVNYEVITPDGNPDYPAPADQRKIITRLEHMGALKIHQKNYFNSTPTIYETPMFGEIQGNKPKGYQLDMNENDFGKTFSEYENRFSSIAPQVTTKKPDEHYIVKDGEGFRYKGVLLSFSDNFACKVFRALYDLAPDGGEVLYAKLEEQIQKTILEKKNLSGEKMRKFILSNLTDKHNGFLYSMNIRENMPNGKPLIWIKRGKAVVFNNKKS
jgi:hypothetical protein